MRKKCFSFIAAAVLAVAPFVQAEPVNYSIMPADTAAYCHFDMDRFQAAVLSIAAAQPGGKPTAENLAAFDKVKGMFANSITVVSRSNLQTVFVLHASKEIRQLLLRMGDDAHALSISYGNQAIRVFSTKDTSGSMLAAIPGLGNITSKPAATQKVHAKKAVALDSGDGNFYVAELEDKGLIVGTTDLQTLTSELDLLGGKGESLAKNDARKIRIEAPDALVVGFMDLEVLEKNAPATVGEESDKNELLSALSFDLATSLSEKSQQIRFILSEDGKDFRTELKIQMADAASAETMQRFILGVKSFGSILYPDHKEKMDPITAKAADRMTEVQWTWPLAKLEDLIGIKLPQQSK